MGQRAVFLTRENNHVTATTVQWSMHIHQNMNYTLMQARKEEKLDEILRRIVDILKGAQHISCIELTSPTCKYIDQEDAEENKILTWKDDDDEYITYVAGIQNYGRSVETYEDVTNCQAQRIMQTHPHNQDGVSMLIDLDDHTLTFHSARDIAGFARPQTHTITEYATHEHYADNNN